MDVRRALVAAQLASIALAFGGFACGSDGSSSLLGTPRDRSGTSVDGGIAYGGVILPSVDGSCPGDMTACNGVCSDTSTDLLNCGACGVTCGGACALSRCVVTLASGGNPSAGPGGIAVDGTSVYYFSSTGLMSVPVGGGTASTVAPLTGNGIALSSTTVYWTTNTAVISQPIGGGDPVTIASSGGQAIAVNGASVYWTTDSAVMSVPVAGLADGGAPTSLAVGQNDPFGLALGASGVYWTNGGTLDLGGGYAPGTGTIASVAVSATAPIDDDGGTDAGSLGDGGTEHPNALMTVAAAQNYPHGIAVDATNVYWAASGSTSAQFADGAILSAPLSGVVAGGTPTVLATSQPFAYAVAVDATTLYWTCNDNGGTSGGVMSLPLGGGPAVPLAKGQDSPTAIAVDATSVYWMTGSGALMKATPK